MQVFTTCSAQTAHRHDRGYARTGDERTARGERIGTLTRWNAPPEGEPRYTAAKGSKRDLIFRADDLPAYAGTSGREPVIVAEGASDTACLYMFAFTDVGVPMTGRATGELAALRSDRHVVLIGDDDPAGRLSIQPLAAALVGVCASVRLTFPLEEHKYGRSWVADGATHDAGESDVSRLIEEAQPYEPSAPETPERPPVPEFVLFPTEALPKAAADLVRAGAGAMQVDEARVLDVAAAVASLPGLPLGGVGDAGSAVAVE